tara:strand:- start:35645 stop:35992 length:348 start_codon:yes stop_codon:yes gene_type:complete
MGLDQYAGIQEDGSKEIQSIAEWRKHPNLQGWMENLWRDKSPCNSGEFNCVDVELTLDDVSQLEKDVLENNLPMTHGFFFGDGADSYYKEADLNFCQAAKEAIGDGKKVFYTSWW